jgi:hypothetical protein
VRKLATEAGFRPTVSEGDILVSLFWSARQHDGIVGALYGAALACLLGRSARHPRRLRRGARRSRAAALTATNAAKLYGLHPRKGTITVGSDADLAIWDADREVTIRQSMIHDAMDYTPY